MYSKQHHPFQLKFSSWEFPILQLHSILSLVKLLKVVTFCRGSVVCCLWFYDSSLLQSTLKALIPLVGLAQLQAEPVEEERLAKQREEDANITKWDDVQAMMDADYGLALMDKRKKHFARLRAKEQRRKPPTKAQKRNQRTMILIDSFVPMDSEVVKRSKDKAEGKKAELKLCLEIVPNDDEVVNFEPLATKSPIVDWKTQILGEEMIYYQIKRTNGSCKMYKVFCTMLNDFDRQDLIDLYRLVTERFKTTRPEGSDRLLWGDLITIFEPSKEDELWKNQQNYTLISEELYDSCGVHSLLMDIVYIHMLVERTYPLTQLTLEIMLNGRLQIDHECEMAYKLIRFIKS
ncbi:hypothetical protein Tco_0516927 [Tanacetum coccineum]